LADRPCFRAEEMFGYRYGGPRGHRTARSSSGRARLALGGIHLPPLDFPERRRRVRERVLPRRVPPKRPKRRPRPRGSAIQRPQRAGISRCSSGRCSNLPTAHRAHPAALRERVPSAVRRPQRPQASVLALPQGGSTANVDPSSRSEGTVETSR
jgi:hypothetical protein